MKSLRFLVFVYTVISFFSKISIAADILGPNQSISDGQTLVSSAQTFELGFFSPGNSNNRYLGIWYKNIPFPVLWVANRDNPLTDSSGVLLTIGNHGNIVLLNQSKSVIWSSNSSRTAENPVAQLLDTGNFVLKDDIADGNSESYLWESFDHPTDTMLLGMKDGWNFKPSRRRFLISWKNMDDPSPGDFSYGMDLHGLPQLILRNGSTIKFRTAPRNGLRFSGIPYFWSNPTFKPNFISNGSDENFVITRFVVNQSGILQRLTWDVQSLNWIVMFTLPKDQCDNYGECGANGICNISNSIACECLQGFTPKSQEDWKALNWSGGCVRRMPLDCRKKDRFVTIEKVKLPDTSHSWVNKSMTIEECEVRCLKNCSCTAYANSDISGGGSGCILWFGDLFDIRKFIDDGAQSLYIRFAASEQESMNTANKNNKRVVMIVILSVGSAMLLLGLISWCIIWMTRRKKEGNEESQKEDLELPLFDLITILTATDNFSSTNKIGEGGFGPVYKGKLAKGQDIAVKRLSKDSGQGLAEFKNEMILIAKLQHRNLVKLLGFYIQGEEKMLIYEYMPNKSLNHFIFDQNRSKLLTWQKRFDIVMGIARGLLYLHQDSRLRVIHRDLKTSNVLLDSELNPKISDFGMARIFGGDQTEAKTRRVVGTYGYISPEYAIDGKFSVKSDVFSFGVLVLEIVSGKKNRGFYHPDHHHNLLGHAWLLWKDGAALELMEACLEDSCIAFEVLRCIQVGLLCVQRHPKDRPSMSSVVLMLGSESASLPQPKEPGFFTERSSTDTSTEEYRTENVVTITSLEAR